MGILIGYTYFNKDEGRLIQSRSGEQASYGVGELETVVGLIDKRYFDTISRKQIVDAAITSTLDELDTYSRYLPPEQKEADNASLSTDFRGIGIEMIKIEDSIRILHSAYASATRGAGVDEGDVILKVNGKPMVGPDVTYDQLRREVISQDTCHLTYLDYQTNSPNQVSLPVIDIENSDATIHGMLSDSVGLIKIQQFNSRTYEQFMQSLESLDSMSSHLNLIIDVRSNPGGYLPQVIKIIEQLIYDKDKLLLSTVNRDRSEKNYYSKAKNFFKVDKMAVLIDENSASASEILAGVLQDLDRAVVIGLPSFGKGLVQEQFDLSSGGKIRLTVAEYLMPSGRSIQKWEKIGYPIEHCDTTVSAKSSIYYRDLPTCQGVVPDIQFDLITDCNRFDYNMHKLTIGLDEEEISSDVQLQRLFNQNEVSYSPMCLSDTRSSLLYQIRRRQMSEEDAAFAKIKEEPIIKKTLEVLKQPMRATLTGKGSQYE